MSVKCPHCGHLLDSIEMRQRWAFRLNAVDGSWQWKLLEAGHVCAHCGKDIGGELLREAGLGGIYSPLVWSGEGSPWRRLRLKHVRKGEE